MDEFGKINIELEFYANVQSILCSFRQTEITVKYHVACMFSYCNIILITNKKLYQNAFSTANFAKKNKINLFH